MPKNNHNHNNLVVIVIIRVVKVQEAYVDGLLRFLTILNDLHIPDNPEYNHKKLRYGGCHLTQKFTSCTCIIIAFVDN